MSHDTSFDRKPVTMRLTEATRDALKARAKKLGTSQANALGILLGTMPESAYANTDKRNKLVTR